MGSLEGQFDTKLHEAVRYGDIEEVKVALQQGYDPNLIGLYQWSALHEAANNGETEILKLLLAKKGDPNKTDYHQGRTATHYAAEKGHLDCLKMLVDAGAKYDIQDADGKTCLDVATPGGKKIFERIRVRDIMLKSDTLTELDDKDEGISTDRSHDQTSSVSTSRRSSLLSLQDKGPALGYVHLSVEYHSVKSSLKIRIWQLSDLLLPPPNTSMIHSIYVKSYLQPDKKRESKRKTEEVKVDSSGGHIHWGRKKQISIQHVFTPATFKFSRPLEYSGITDDTIRDKQLQIEVCITQRYSHRSFLIGMLKMSLKSAVKKVVKEKLPLIPCMNHTIPSSMKVYCASELSVINNSPGGDFFFSNPNVRIVLPDDIDDASEKAASNPDLQAELQHSPSTEVNMNMQYRIMPDVPKLDFSAFPLDESGYSSELHISFPSEIESPDSDSSKSSSLVSHKYERSVNSPQDLKKVTRDRGVEKAVLENIQEHSIATAKDKNADTNIEITDLDSEDLGEVLVGSKTNKREKATSFSNKSKQQKADQMSESIIKIPDIESEDLGEVLIEKSKSKREKSINIVKSKSDKTNKKSDEDSSSRPETPTWDYYDIPTEVVSQEVERSTSPWKEGAAPVILPMGTTMGIASAKSSSQVTPVKKEKEKSLRRSKKKASSAIPGKAIPLVPMIVVTTAEHDNDKPPASTVKETAIDMPSDIVLTKSHTSTGKGDIPDDNTQCINLSNSDKGARPKTKSLLKKIDRKLFVNVGKAVSKKSEGSEENIEMQDKRLYECEQNIPETKPKMKKLRKQREHKDTENTGNKTEVLSNKPSVVPPLKLNQRGIKEPSILDMDRKPVATKNARTGSGKTGSSVVVDMDKLTLSASGAHVVELIEDDISITELAGDDPLFTDRSEVSFSAFTDVESGLGDYKLPERVSPTKYMIPMQVYDVDDTSCDESLA